MLPDVEKQKPEGSNIDLAGDGVHKIYLHRGQLDIYNWQARTTYVRAARGFRKAHRSVPASHYDWVKVELSDVMGVTSFYEFRRGKRPIMPDTQEKILAALRKYGAAEPVEFDAYEDILDWGDRLV